MKSISVLLATYNGERYLRQQLHSLARQTYLPAELVVTDDHSSDGTIGIVEDFARTAPFPVHIHRGDGRLGYRFNFMRGLAFCQSDLVAFCDQDDVWDERKLAVAEEAFADPDVVLFLHNAWLIDQNNKRLQAADIYPIPPRNPPLTVHSLYNPYGFAMVFDSKLLGLSDLWSRSVLAADPSLPLAHDTWIYFLSAIFGTIISSDQKLTDYRQHTGNAYGAPDKGLAAKLRHLLRFRVNHGERYKAMAHAVHVRARLLAESQARLSGAWQDRAVAGASRCQEFSDRLAWRASLYGNAALFERARIVFSLRRGGAYGLDGGFGLGSEAFAKDVVLGILLRRFLVRPAQSKPQAR